MVTSYILERVDFEYESKAAINAKIESIEELYLSAGIDKVKNLLKRYDPHDYNYFYLLRDKNNQKSYGNLNELPTKIVLYDQDFVIFKLKNSTMTSGPTGIKNHKKGSTIMARIIHFPDGSDLILGRNIEQIETIKYKVNQLLLVIAGLLSSIAFISFFVSNYVVKKINIIGKTTERIRQTGDLSRRIKLTTNWDDLSNLAVLLNAMLADIENLLEGVKHVSDNIAHDLRIPLTRFRNQIENLNYDEIKTSAKVFREQKKNLITEVDKLLNSFNALLKISYLETGKSKVSFVSTSLAELLNDAVELYQPIAEDKNIDIKTNISELSAFIDRDLVFQAIINLIDNAIKYTPAKGCICVDLYEINKRPIIEISDTGPGINDDEKQKVFERFYRVDKSRNTKGSGLGLSLVSAVISAHKGKIELIDHNPGLKVRITL